ncbi:translocation/assembly module TamB domain-containing protein [Parasphingorhabdus sp. JC815]|uniref:translocation/assembly module TamB domain-containing protein n=1 Tax=Parasphingorhabdus sp. JC815 TaxID=3232140 RepID=UPI00345A9878
MAEEEKIDVAQNDRLSWSWPKRISAAIGGLFVFAFLLLAGVYFWADSQSGKRFIIDQIEATEFENGLKINVGAIEGSIHDEMQLHNLVIGDPEGVFLSAKQVDVDWRPLAFIGSHIDIRALNIPEARLHRLPEFRETPPSNEPLLPDLDIDIGKFDLGRLIIDPPVTGQRHIVAFGGDVHIADRRAVVNANGRALTAENVAGGDRFALDLDATPEQNRLNIALELNAPENGLVAALSGIAKPIQLSIKGKGDWNKWDGSLSGTSGNEKLSDVALTARNGTFTANGMMRPGLLLAGASQNLLEPVTNIDVKAAAEERRFQIDGNISNDNFVLRADGLVDLGESRIRDLVMEFRLLQPGTLAENLNGAGIVASATLNGEFVAPELAYVVNAARIGFDETTVIGLRANGSAQMDDEGWIIPLEARAQRIGGLNAAAGELLTNVRLNGDLAFANGRLLSDNMKIRSDRIDATAILLADMNSGLYSGALKGRVNGYRVDSVGVFNLQTDVDLETAQNGGFRLAGRVQARSSRIFNDGVRDFLGGNSLIVANVSYGSDGVARVDSLNVAAPAFRLTSGSGRYTADGGIDFTARGVSNQYGPLGVDISGSLARPVAKIAASRPGLGVGLRDVVATVRGNGNDYAVIADGESDYGSFDANVDILMGRGPLTIAVNDGTSFAGIGLTGRIRQTTAGPFSGQLAANGSGINGNVALSSTDGKQRALIDATAQDAALPGPANLTIGRAIIDADIILYDRPQLVADIQLANTYVNELQIASARAKIDYRGSKGSAKIMAEGRSGFPFRFAANSVLQPDLWRVAIDGRANGIDFKTEKPARIIPGKNGYMLRPTTINLSNGSIQLAGDYGEVINIQSRLKNVDLALINPMVPGLGLGGRATGSLDFEQSSPSAFPHADARLRIDDFTRTSLAARSQPVDIYTVGRLLPDGGNARVIIRRRGAAIGRMHVNLRPLAPGAGSWTTRLLAAPLSGGLRYNGPAETLFSLAALPDQNLKGAIGVAADFSGRVKHPELSGVVRANKLTYVNQQYGTRLTNMQLRGRFTNDRLEVEKLTATAGDGTVSGSGFVSLSSKQGFPVQLALDLDNAQLAKGSDLAAAATGQLQVVNSPNQPGTISGTLRLPETRYKIVRQGAAEVATLTGIRRKPARGRERITGDAEPISGVPQNWRLDIDIAADNQIFVSGMGLDSEWAANIHVGGTTGNPRIEGGINLVRGNLGFAGRSFELQEGRIRFDGGAMTNPAVRLIASGEADDVNINITVSGTGENPDIVFSSTPSLPQDEIMSRILFGNSIGQLSAVQAVQLAASLNSLSGSGGGLNPLGVLQQSAGIDRLRILGADEETGRGTSLAAGQYISNDVYVEIITDARGHTATQIEISLTKALSVLSQVGSFGGSNVNVQYRKDY